MSRWRKLGRIFKAEGQRAWMQTHTACPVGVPVGEGRVRIYFGTRDADNRPSVGHLTIDIDDPLTPLQLATEPALAPGDWGMFDDNGVYPGCIVERDGHLVLYYMGRSNGTPPLYYMAIGMAASDDGGMTFRRLRADPIVARGPHDPWMVSTPFVLQTGSRRWTMWYLSGLGWNSLTPPSSRYNIKVAHSRDGVEWTREGVTAFDFAGSESNVASPCVWPTGAGFEAVFCAASPGAGYELRGARSADGIAWQRTSAPPEGLALSASGWDAECMAYPSSFEMGGSRYLLYSGNGNGRDGFGLAVAA